MSDQRKALERLGYAGNAKNIAGTLANAGDQFDEIKAFKAALRRQHSEIEALKAERDALIKELEEERMKHVACGVIAMANTPKSAKKARDIHPAYRSASVRDVENAVDREMALRAERDALRDALRPFADLYCEHHKPMRDDQPIFGINSATFTVGDLRRADAMLKAREVKP